MKPETLDRIYRSYSEWKSWSGSPQASVDVFEKELKRANVPAGSRILEVGFGDGGFLEWAAGQGYSVLGVDRSEDCVNQARKNGHDVHLDAGGLDFLEPESVDVIFAFDVLEHMDMESILAFLDRSREVLTEDGLLLARVPNCASPYGMAFQFGDLTHLTPLSESSLQQLGIATNLTCEGVHPYLPSTKGEGLLSLLRRMVFAVRSLHGIAVSYLYYGKRVIMEPAITVIFRK